MHGDFSRLTFDSAKQYSRVWMQQGRVHLDADWNELVEMLNHRLETECRDLVGTCAVPQDHPGFGIRMRKGLHFDGQDDFIWVGETRSFSFAGFHPFTIEAWVNPDIKGDGGTIVSKFHPHAATPAGEYCLSVQRDRTILFQRVELKPDPDQVERVSVLLAETSSIEGTIEVINALQAEQEWEPVVHRVATARAIPSGQFSHVAVVYDGREIKLYLDGHLVALSPSSHPGAHSHCPFLIGAAFHEHPSHSFHGVIDEVRVWRSDRTAAQIQDDLRRPLTEPRAGLVGNWQFLEGEGDQIEDWSGNGHMGWRDSNREECKPQWVPAEAWISRGRCYVEGILCENQTEILLTKQPYLSNSQPDLTHLATGACLLYLDVWQRFVTAIEDPTIREVALGGIDTTARSQTIWQIRSLPLPQTAPIHPDQAHLLLESMLPMIEQRGRLKVRQTTADSLADNRLYRVEIHSSGGAYGDRTAARWHSADTVRVATTSGQIEITKRQTSEPKWAIGQCVELIRRDIHHDNDATELGTLAQILQIDPDHHRLTLDVLPDDWEVGTAIQIRAIASFKWSRDNGALVFAIDRLEDRTVTLQDQRHISPILKAGTWVEILDDDTALGNQAPYLCQIDKIDPGGSPVVLLQQAPVASVGQNPTKHPLLRCWDQTKAVKMGVIPVQIQHANAANGNSSSMITLENGIQVEFEGSYFQRGDFWWIATRRLVDGSASPGIAWDSDENGQPIARSPQGIIRYYTPLAVLHSSHGKPVIRDLRQMFAPQSAAAVSKAGDTMSGSLTIDASLQVNGDAYLEGSVEVGTLYGQLAPNLVGTEQLVDQSVTLDKLATEVGTIPPGVFILGDTQEAPSGYISTGLNLHLPQSQVPWTIDPTPLPQPGRLSAVVMQNQVQNQIFAIYDSGEIWSYNPLPRLGRHPWVQHPSIPQPHRSAFGVAVFDSRIYIVGGLDATGKRTGRVDSYDPTTQTWLMEPPMPTPRSHLGVIAMGHYLHAIGGLVESNLPFIKDRSLNVHEVYHLATNTWVPRCPLPGGRYGFVVGVVKGRLYAIAGKRKWFFNLLGKVSSDRNQMYSPTTDTWFNKPALPLAKSHLAVAAMGDKLYVTGGKDLLGASSSIDVYDPAGEAWSEEFQMSSARQCHGAVSIHGKLYVLGGENGSTAIGTLEEGFVLSTLYIHQKSGKSLSTTEILE